MPTSYVIDVKRRLVISTGEGVYCHADAMEHIRRLKADPKFDPGFNQFLDGTRLTGVRLSTEEVIDIAKHSVFSGKSRRAMLTTNDLVFGLGRVFEAYRNIQGEEGIRIFRKREEALQWLGLDPGDPPDQPPAL